MEGPRLLFSDSVHVFVDCWLSLAVDKRANMNNPKRDFVVRFAVGNTAGQRSSVWRVWKSRTKDDVYLAPRPMAHSLKGSLHASGLCYFSITSDKYAQMADSGSAPHKRAFVRWHRPSTPKNAFVCATKLLFPSEYLQCKYTPVLEDEVMLIEVPKQKETVVVDLVFGPAGSEIALGANQRTLAQTTLSNLEEFVIVASTVTDFDADLFQRTHQPSSPNAKLGFLEVPPHTDPDQLRGALLLPGGDHHPLRIVEIGPAFVT